ncbi:MAG: hypothetical protein NTY22_08860 [Proteobacteria bacterium]|nr:hypothetical protein [Pseudomonadota bacterium]
MKKLVVLAIALGFISATAFANGLNFYNPGAIGAAEQAEALNLYYLQQQYQMQLNYQQKILDKISNGDTTSPDVVAFMKQQQAQQDQQNQQNQQILQAQQDQQNQQNKYYNTMAAQQNEYLTKNGSKDLASYYKKIVENQGRIKIAETQDQLNATNAATQANDIQRQAELKRIRCNTGTGLLMNIACADQYYNDSLNSLYRAMYDEEAHARSWFNSDTM